MQPVKLLTLLFLALPAHAQFVPTYSGDYRGLVSGGPASSTTLLPNSIGCFGDSLVAGACSVVNVCTRVAAGIPGVSYTNAQNWATSGHTAQQIRDRYFANYATACNGVASRRRDAAAWSFPLAAAWLLATVLAGVVLALNRRHPFLQLSILDLLRAHAHLGLVGYFATLLQGVTFQLVSMFTMGEARRATCAKAGLFSAQAGLVLLGVGLASGTRPLGVVASLVILSGLAATGYAFVATLATRRRRKLEPALRAFVIGLSLLGAAAVLGALLVIVEISPDKFFPAAAVYGLLVVAGGLSLAVLGMLLKILPFLVWMKAYGPRVGRTPVPVATTLSSKPLEHLWLTAHLGGLCGLAVGVATDARWPARVGGVLLFLAATVFLANALRVLRHLRVSIP